MPKFTLKSILKAVIPVLIGVYLMWFGFSQMRGAVKSAFYNALWSINYGYVLLAICLSFGAIVIRAIRWKILLDPLGYSTNFWHRYHAISIGYVINLTIPRAGEASRSLMLQRFSKVPFAPSFGTIIAERVVDLCMLFLIVLVTSSIASTDFWLLKNEITRSFGPMHSSSNGAIFWTVVIGVLVLLIGLFIYLFPKLKSKLIQFVKDALAGVFALFHLKQPIAFLLHTLLIWGIYLVYFFLCFLSLPETATIPIQGVLIAFIAGTVGISLTNGGIGIYPLVVGLVITHYLKQDWENTALAIGYAMGTMIWASQTILILLLGIISFVFLPKKTVENG